MITWQPLRRVDSVAIAQDSGITKYYYPRLRIPNVVRFGLSGLGQVSLPGVSDAGSLPIDDPLSVFGAASGGISVDVPGIGTIDTQTISTVQGMIATFESWFGIGAGRREADVIVPVQNQIVASWQNCVNAILVGQPCNLATLNRCYLQVWQSAVAFMQFVQRSAFTDGRASQQALNTVMPYVDGSCGYHWPPPMHPTQFNCMPWGGGTIGGDGTTGILGAIARAIHVCGGSGPPTVTPGPGGVFPHPSPVPPTDGGGILFGGLSGTNLVLIGAGVLVLMMYGRRRG